MRNQYLTLAALFGGLIMIGCGTADTEQQSGASGEGSKYLASSEPSGGTEVIEAKEAVQDGEDVTVVGRIGGQMNPWIEGFAAFQIVDPDLKACSDTEGDQCPYPWDYCCEPRVNEGSAIVKVVDEQGNPVSTDARKLLGVKELQTVVVSGKAQRDDSGNFTILADKVYVRPGTGVSVKQATESHGHDHEHGHDRDHDHEDGHEHDQESGSAGPSA